MTWKCPERTYLNPLNQKIRAMCELGYRFFPDTGVADEDDSTIATNEEEDSESMKTRMNSLMPDDDSLLGESSSMTNNFCTQRFTFVGSSSTKKDTYIHKDSHVLYG